jgi:diguanylate cyclase (GGDEF)-like protein
VPAPWLQPSPSFRRTSEEHLVKFIEPRERSEARARLTDERATNEEQAEGITAAEEAPQGGTHQLGPTRGLHQRYIALVWRGRLAVVAFWLAMAAFLVWAIPWIPSGLSPEDYSREMVLAFMLAGATTGLGMVAVFLHRRADKIQEALIAWSTVYDETTGLFNRRYFYDRLTLECDRAKVSGGSFAVTVLRLEDGSSSEGIDSAALRTAADQLGRSIRSTDTPAILSGGELAVVLARVGDALAEEVAARLLRAAQDSLAGKPGITVRLGLSTYGRDGRGATALLRAAHRDMKKRARAAGRQQRSEQAA